jgi:hypothetical protein
MLNISEVDFYFMISSPSTIICFYDVTVPSYVGSRVLATTGQEIAEDHQEYRGEE